MGIKVSIAHRAPREIPQNTIRVSSSNSGLGYAGIRIYWTFPVPDMLLLLNSDAHYTNGGMTSLMVFRVKMRLYYGGLTRFARS